MSASDRHGHEPPELTEGDLKWLHRIEERRLRGLALRDRVRAAEHGRHLRELRARRR